MCSCPEDVIIVILDGETECFDNHSANHILHGPEQLYLNESCLNLKFNWPKSVQEYAIETTKVNRVPEQRFKAYTQKHTHKHTHTLTYAPGVGRRGTGLSQHLWAGAVRQQDS